MKLNIVLAAAFCLAVAACSESPAPEVGEAAGDAAVTANPLLEKWDTPFGVPPFDRISSENYLPAIRTAMQEHNAEVDAIVANADAPTFENTIEALERSGKTFSSTTRIFFALDSANADDVIKETAKTLAPELSAHGDNISLNKELFDRVLTVYEQRDDLGLGGEQEHLLEETHKQFVRSGANLEEVDL